MLDIPDFLHRFVLVPQFHLAGPARQLRRASQQLAALFLRRLTRLNSRFMVFVRITGD
jgi:hypothetical protein